MRVDICLQCSPSSLPAHLSFRRSRVETSVICPLPPPRSHTFDPSSSVSNDRSEGCPWLPLCDPCPLHKGNDDLVLYISFLITCPLGGGTKLDFSSFLSEGLQQASHTYIILNSYPSNRGKFASPPQLQNEVGIHPLCHLSPCICVSFAGGQETLGNRSERGAKTPAPCTSLLVGRAPRVLLGK